MSTTYHGAEGRLAAGLADYAHKQEETVRMLEVALAKMTQQRDAALEAACHLAEKMAANKTFMRVCPECGDKRCPKATDHNKPCKQGKLELSNG